MQNCAILRAVQAMIALSVLAIRTKDIVQRIIEAGFKDPLVTLAELQALVPYLGRSQTVGVCERGLRVGRRARARLPLVGHVWTTPGWQGESRLVSSLRIVASRRAGSTRATKSERDLRDRKRSLRSSGAVRSQAPMASVMQKSLGALRPSKLQSIEKLRPSTD
jgi:hypothetical protein